MAVVSISRIQVRRGTKNQGTGLPQLASGEFGWAIDTQELYIGNGSTSEGAPAVGNTKVLTENTNILNLVGQYTYREDAVTGTVERTLAERLNDQVSIKAFAGSPAQKLQKAFYELYLLNNTIASTNTPINTVDAPILYINPGEYVISETIYVPPYTTIIGAGKDKTVLRKTGDFDMFRTISSESTYTGEIASAVEVFESSQENQARKIRFEHMTLEAVDTPAGNRSHLLLLENCRNSEFKNIRFIHRSPTSSSLVSDSQVGLGFISKSDAVNSNNNRFIDCDFEGLKEAVYGPYTVKNNTFVRCTFNELQRGIILGGTDVSVDGAQNNVVSACEFENVREHAILMPVGKGNKSQNNRYGLNVSSDGGADPAYPIVSYGESGNFSIDDTFERTYNQAVVRNNTKYYPEVEGPTFYTISDSLGPISIGEGESPVFRLPADASKFYTIEYFFNNIIGPTGITTYKRHGTLTVSLNLQPNVNNPVTIVDDYEYLGDDGAGGASIKFTSEIQYAIPGDANSDILAIKVLSNSAGGGPLIDYDMDNNGTIDANGEPGGVTGELIIKITSKS